VATNTTVTATFNEAVQASTVNTTNYVLKDPNGKTVTATVSYNSTTYTATLNPSAALANATKYTCTVSGVLDTAGDPMNGPFSCSFTTATTSSAPTVIAESPASGATGVIVMLNNNVTATFNEAVQASTINFTLTDGSGHSVPATVWYSDDTNTATLTPQSSSLAASTKYTATVSGVVSTSGVAMGAAFSWSFTTAAATATTPTVVGTSPSFNATSVDISTPIAVNFNEAVLSSSISSANYTLTDASGKTVSATITYADTGSLHTATLTPSAALATSSTYTVAISKVKDSGGNTMASPYTWSFVTASGSTTDTQLPLAYQSNLQYLGGFRVPNGTIGASQFNYAGNGLAFNPANNSLFITGYENDNSAAEIAIPGSIVNSSNLSNLATASVLQSFVNVFPRIPNTSNLGDGTWATKGPVKLGGFTVVNGQLVGTEYVFYDTSGTTVVTHFRFDSLTLASAKVEGMFQVGNLGGGFYDGYMSPIPTSWQSDLGAPYLTGNCCLSIITRTSFGPAVFGFDPSKLSSSGSAATPYVYYTQSNPAGPIDYHNLLFEGNTTIRGVFFVPGTRTVLFFGSIGTNQVGYGLASDYNDQNRNSKGYHSLNGDYAYQVWAYDANDFLAVKGGQMQPWQVQPYAVWNLDFPQNDGAKYIGGVAFDPSTNRLYVTQLGGDTQVAYTYLPVVQVFQLSLNSTAGSHPKMAGLSVHAAPNHSSEGSTSGATDPVERSTGRATFVVSAGLPAGGSENLVLGTVPLALSESTPGARPRAIPHRPVQQTRFSRSNTILRLSNRNRIGLGTGSAKTARGSSLLDPGFVEESALLADPARSE
jgi:hypothetical protein